MKDLLAQFENKRPEIVFEWKDAETEAEGWVVINSLRGGAAGGGTRMRQGLDKREVESLAKTMEVKFTVSGPAIGGAKSGINFDPQDPRKRGVLERWYKAVIPAAQELLRHRRRPERRRNPRRNPYYGGLRPLAPAGGHRKRPLPRHRASEDSEAGPAAPGRGKSD